MKLANFFRIALVAAVSAWAVGSDAATNGDVASTVIEFRSDGKNAITAKAGDTVPVSLYIPQSSGFYSLSLKMSINGAKTLGQGPVTDLEGRVHENFKDAFGNYGIKIKDVAWPDVDNGEFFCLNSGAVHDSSMFAGYWNADSMTFFTEDAYNIQYLAVTAINSEKNIDALGPWVKAGSPDDYSSYTPVYTWTKDEDWAFEYSFVDFKLALPADLPDGTYTLDLYYDEYVNCSPSALFDETTNKELPDDQKIIGQTGASGVKGAQRVTSVPLKIVVGNPAPPSVSNVVARQRWPWNGYVDVDYEVGGTTDGLVVRVSFAEQGGEGRTWVATNFLASARPSAAPGPHRATWNAPADGVTNAVAANVVATVLLVAATTATGTATVTPSGETSASADESRSPGNVDCVGGVDVADAALLAKLIAEDSEARVSRQGIRNSDVNSNGNPDSGDVIKILKYIAKLIGIQDLH